MNSVNEIETMSLKLTLSGRYGGIREVSERSSDRNDAKCLRSTEQLRTTPALQPPQHVLFKEKRRK